MFGGWCPRLSDVWEVGHREDGRKEVTRSDRRAASAERADRPGLGLPEVICRNYLGAGLDDAVQKW
jgi:hypothetical protein